MPDIQENIRDEKGRFKKGHSGNPAGCPVGTLNLTTKLRIALDKVFSGDKTAADVMIDRMVALAIKKGDSKLI